MWWLLVSLFLHGGAADDPCNAMTMVNGVVTVDATAICLGTPCAGLIPGLYLAPGASIVIQDTWTMAATLAGFSISGANGTLLSCAEGRCFAGSEIPSTFMQFPPALYLGYEPYRENINGVWMAESILRLANADGSLTRKMKVRLLASPEVTGTMTIEGRLVVVELMTGMRIVGNATSSSILNSLDWAGELVAGPIIINTATLVESCRPSPAFLSIPLPNVNNILEITNYTGLSMCGRYSYRDKQLVKRQVIDLTFCYSTVDFPWFAQYGAYFKMPLGCGSVAPKPVLLLHVYTTIGCTGTFIRTINYPLTCSGTTNMDCYDTN